MSLLLSLLLLLRYLGLCHELGGGGGKLSFQDTGLCHSNRKSTTHKSGEISQEYTHKSGEISQKYTHKSGEFLKIIPINPGMLKQLTNK